jgi:hypothetical protein
MSALIPVQLSGHVFHQVNTLAIPSTAGAINLHVQRPRRHHFALLNLMVDIVLEGLLAYRYMPF